jgi:hypothetical protein
MGAGSRSFMHVFIRDVMGVIAANHFQPILAQEAPAAIDFPAAPHHLSCQP